MDESSLNIVRSLHDDREIQAFSHMLARWLVEEQANTQGEEYDFTESRARALLVSANLLDGATLGDFGGLVGTDRSPRIILCDLLDDSGLAKQSQVSALIPSAQVIARESLLGEDKPQTAWLALIIASYAWKRGYSVDHLDSASPPESFTPAGQVLQRSASFVRRQIQRSATDRDRLLRELAQPSSAVPSLDELSPGPGEEAPMPPHYRPPVPERYPEMSSETLLVDPDEPTANQVVTTGAPIVITGDEIEQDVSSESEVVHMPPITIEQDQVSPETITPPSPMPSSAVVVPSEQGSQSRSSLTVALRQMLRHEQLANTKLRIEVQQYPDGPGLYGLQVRVRCKGVKSYVAGTTDRDGKFVCELPVRVDSGLTYDVEVTWPRDQGGDVERKSITMNADRTYFTLPFYRQLSPPSDA